MTSSSSQPENRHENDYYDSRGGGGTPNELGRGGGGGGVVGCKLQYRYSYNQRVRIAEIVEVGGQTRLLFYPTDERFLGERVFLPSPPRNLSTIPLLAHLFRGGMSCISIPPRKVEGRFNSLQPAIHASLPPPFPSVHFCASTCKQGLPLMPFPSLPPPLFPPPSPL